MDEAALLSFQSHVLNRIAFQLFGSLYVAYTDIILPDFLHNTFKDFEVVTHRAALMWLPPAILALVYTEPM